VPRRRHSRRVTRATATTRKRRHNSRVLCPPHLEKKKGDRSCRGGSVASVHRARTTGRSLCATSSRREVPPKERDAICGASFFFVEGDGLRGGGDKIRTSAVWSVVEHRWTPGKSRQSRVGEDGAPELVTDC